MGFVITTVINLGFEMKNYVEDEKAHVYLLCCASNVSTFTVDWAFYGQQRVC